MKFFSTTKTRSRRVRGFSFLEVIISLFVLSVGFLGVISLSVETLKQSFLQRDALIASMLAQEGVEGVYNIRDSNIASDLTNIFQGIDEGIYRVTIESSSSLSSGSGDFYRLYLDSNNFYKHGGGTSTKFFRTITVTEGSDPTNPTRTIVSMVSWDGNVPPTDASNCNKSNRCALSWAELREND